MTRRFEYTDGKSNKFWENTVTGNSVTVTYGRIGTDGQTQVKKYATPAEAKAAAEKQIAEKVRKGYRERKAASVGKKPAVRVKKAKSARKAAPRAATPASGAVTPLRKQDLMRQIKEVGLGELWNSSFEVQMSAKEWSHLKNGGGEVPSSDMKLVSRVPGGKVKVRVKAESYLDDSLFLYSNFRHDFDIDVLEGSREYSSEELEEWMHQRFRNLLNLYNPVVVLSGSELYPGDGADARENPHTIFGEIRWPNGAPPTLAELNPAWTGDRFALDNSPLESFWHEL